MPASREPTITVEAPAASALAMSPLVRMPPSAITGTPLRARGAASMIAVSCGTPTPATIRVVQIEPGPMPTLIASAPASTSAFAASRGRDIAGDDLHRVRQPLHPLDRARRRRGCGRARCRSRSVAPRVDQRLGALEALVADGSRGGDPQPPFGVLGRVRGGTAFSMSLTVIRPTQ